MDTLEGIKEKVGRCQYEFSKHAVDQTIVREIRLRKAYWEKARSSRTILRISTVRAVSYSAFREQGDLCMFNEKSKELDTILGSQGSA